MDCVPATALSDLVNIASLDWVENTWIVDKYISNVRSEITAIRINIVSARLLLFDVGGEILSVPWEEMMFDQHVPDSLLHDQALVLPGEIQSVTEPDLALATNQPLVDILPGGLALNFFFMNSSKISNF